MSFMLDIRADNRKAVKARAVWDFDASRDDELSFRVGDILVGYRLFPAFSSIKETTCRLFNHLCPGNHVSG